MSASNPGLFTGNIMRLVFTMVSEKQRWQPPKGISDGYLRCCSGLCSQMKGLLWWLSSKTFACDAEVHLQCRRPGFDPWVRKIPGRRKWQPTPVFLPGKLHGQRSLVGYSPRGCKSWTRLSMHSHSACTILVARTLFFLRHHQFSSHAWPSLSFQRGEEEKSDSTNIN